MLKFSESFHLHHNCCMTTLWESPWGAQKGELLIAQTLCDGHCKAFQGYKHILDMQAAQPRKAVHNARYMLKVCLQGQPLQHSPYSKSNWFTEFCKSLCLSQFTASFISVWAKASIAECIDKLKLNYVKQQNCEAAKWCYPPLLPHNPATTPSLKTP